MEKEMHQTWEEFKDENRGREYLVLSEYGPIRFSRDGMKDVVGGENLTFEEYLDAQKPTSKTRTGLQSAYYQCPECDFMGIISRKNSRKVLFKRLYISGFDSYMENFSSTEKNVWVDVRKFRDFNVGDAVSFTGTIYQYLFTNGKQQINYAVKKPDNVVKVNEKDIPSDRDVMEDSLRALVCDTCMLQEHCNGFCLMENKRKELVGAMMEAVDNSQ